MLKLFQNPPFCNYDCNCRNKSDCPLINTCLTPSIVCKAMVSATNTPDKKYFRISGYCHRNHNRDFRHKEYVNTKYVWKLKDEGETPSATWKYNVFCQLSSQRRSWQITFNREVLMMLICQKRNQNLSVNVNMKTNC